MHVYRVSQHFISVRLLIVKKWVQWLIIDITYTSPTYTSNTLRFNRCAIATNRFVSLNDIDAVVLVLTADPIIYLNIFHLCVTYTYCLHIIIIRIVSLMQNAQMVKRKCARYRRVHTCTFVRTVQTSNEQFSILTTFFCMRICTSCIKDHICIIVPNSK